MTLNITLSLIILALAVLIWTMDAPEINDDE
jgi:hypothetical protein